MKEYQINEKRNWKAEVFPYDVFIPDESEECLYCLTEKQAEILRGIIEPLGWTTRWYSNSTEVNKDEIEKFRDDLIRRLMMSCCNDNIPVQYRYTEGGALEISIDGGETWTPSPENDTRYNSTQYPPIPGADGNSKKCAAAEGMVILLKEGLTDNLTDDMSRYTLDELINDWVTTIIQTSNPFDTLMRIIANQIFALVISALRAALTTEAYDQLKCILYCEMSENASFTEGSWETVRARVLDEITGIAGIFIEHILFLIGALGMTNLARSGAATEGDCGDCLCTECIIMYNALNPGVPIMPSDTCDITEEGRGSGSLYQVYLAPVSSGVPTVGSTFKVEYVDIGGAYTVGYYDLTATPHIGVPIPLDTDVTGIFMEKNVPFTISAIIVP